MRFIWQGGVSGNLKPAWKRVASHPQISKDTILDEMAEYEGTGDENIMRVFLAGGETRHWIPERMFVEADEDISRRRSTVERGGIYDSAIKLYKPYILESFFYADEDTERLLPFFGDFLLDSGAFTFMQGRSSNIEWEDYVDQLSCFINKNKIQKFFELDIDSVVGCKKVLELRKRLEQKTGKQCIPVWHKSRGIEEFKKICDEYPYVAIGGIVSKEIRPEHYMLLPTLIREAHKRNAKIHGLGFTNLALLPKLHFDSVDSTAWTTGNRFGFIYKFDGKTMQKIKAPEGKRLADPRKVALINYTEWLKFQKYADKNL